MAHSSVVCPHCTTKFVLTDSSAQQSTTCSNCRRKFLIQIDVEGADVEQGLDEKSLPSAHSSVEQLLPPQFLVADPEFVDHRIQTENRQFVLLPDGKGGVKSIDENIIRIEHRGRTVELVALPPAEKRRRQRIINFVFMAIGIVVLIILFAMM